MTALTHTEATPRTSHVRAYLAGTGATGALIAGAVVVFLAIAAWVAFNGFPLGGSGTDEGSASIGTGSAGAPETAAAALGAATGAVAAAPVPGAPVGFATVGGPGGGTSPGGPNGQNGPSTGPIETPPGGGPVADPDANYGTTGLVQNVDQTTSALGLPTNLSGLTGGVTRSVDRTVNNTVNHVGGLIGAPHLGDNLGRTVNETGDRLLGDRGLAGHLGR
jgi:hypothetical protein